MPSFKIKSQCSLVVYGLYLSSAGQGFTVQIHTPDRPQSKTLILSTIADQKIVRNRVLDCHLSPDWRQMPIENTVSSYF